MPIIVSGRLCGGIGVLGVALALAEDEHERERGGAGVDVHDRAAGEVERAHARPASRRRTPSARPGA